MREIKFRAWHLLLKRTCEVSSIDVFGKVFTVVEEDVSGRLDFSDVAFSNGVLRQYTGLKDKNGVEIYEGDIVNITTNWISDLAPNNPPTTSTKVVEFVKGSFQLGHGGFFSNSFIERGKLEVIGNIYENSELLNGNKE